MICQEDLKCAPFGDVWEECLRQNGQVVNYLPEIKKYEDEFLSKR